MKKFLLSIFLIFLILTPSTKSFGGKFILEDVQVHILGSSLHPKQTKKLIPYKKGDQLEQKYLDELKEQLESLDFINSVNFELEKISQNQFRLLAKIRENYILRDISITGNYPFLSREIRKNILVQPGAVYSQSFLQGSEKNIIQFLEKEGFYNSKVKITHEIHKKSNKVDLKVRIDKGHTYRLKDVNIEGNTVLSDNRIKNKLKHWGRFKTSRLKKDLKKIRNLYSKKGYVKARVRVIDTIYDKENKKVSLSLKIKEGKKLFLSFTGNPILPIKSLRSILNFKEFRSYDRYAIRNGVKRLEAYYQQKNYPNVYIHYDIKKTKKTVKVIFDIQAGKRVDLKKVKFIGNKEISNKKLANQIDSKESSLFSRGAFNLNLLLKDTLALNRYYKENGFLEAYVETPDVKTNKQGDQKSIYFPIREGEQYRVGKVDLQSDLPIPTKKILKKLPIKPKKEFTIFRIQEAKNTVLTILQNEGYAYVDLSFENHVNTDQKTVDVTVKIVRGPLVRVRNIIIKGHQRTKEKTILKHFNIKKNDLFIYQKVLDSQLNLRTLGIFSSVRIKPLGFEEKRESIDLIVILHERKTITMNFQGGFDNRNYARAEVNFTKRNLFGIAKQFHARAIGGTKFNRGEMTFHSPRIFGASWNLSNQYFAQYEDEPNYNAYSYGSFISTLKNFGPHWTIGLKEQITRTEVLENQSNITALGNTLFDNTFNEIQLITIFDNRDNFANPQKGFYILFKNTFNSDLSDKNNNFNSVKFNINHNLGFLKRFTFSNTIRYWHTFKITDNPRIPVNKLFFVGGTDTIRGFSEDALDRSGGTIAAILNSELHFKITNNFKIAGFFDTGFLEDSVNAVTKSDWRESAGFGVRYFTPVGPIRIDYGFILDRRNGEPKSRLHFSFGYFF